MVGQSKLTISFPIIMIIRKHDDCFLSAAKLVFPKVVGDLLMTVASLTVQDFLVKGVSTIKQSRSLKTDRRRQ